MPSVHAILQSGNLFVYTMNDPVNFIDPSGKIAISLTTLVVVVIFAAVATPAMYYYYTVTVPAMNDTIAMNQSSRSRNATTAPPRNRDLSSGAPSRGSSSSGVLDSHAIDFTTGELTPYPLYLITFVLVDTN